VRRIAALTVAIATKDRPREATRCLRAVLGGPVIPAEVIVVDQSNQGNSTDLQQMIEPLQSSGARIVHVHHDGTGLAASRNAAIARFTQPVLAVTDDDCVPGAGWAAAIDAAFGSKHPPQAVTGPVLPYGPELPGFCAVSSRTSLKPQVFRSLHSPWRAGTGGNFAISRTGLACAGMYDERLGAGSPGMSGEDIDLQYRLLRTGAAIRYEPDVLVRHQRQEAAKRQASRRRYGHGVGACCALWLRAGDGYAVIILAEWLLLRCRRLLGSGFRGNWRGAVEELLVLWGTLTGIAYGFRA